MSADPTTPPNPNTAVLVELAQVRGQLQALMQLMQQNHQATNERINDFRHAVESRIDSFESQVKTRIDGLEGRVAQVERNERSTAIKSATASAVTLGAIELLKYAVGRH